MSAEPVLVNDPIKSAANEKNHGVTFEEAFSTFDDPNAKDRDDRGHGGGSGDERRNVVGKSDKDRLISAVYVEEDEQDGFIPIRMITARHKLTKKEKDFYVTGVWED